MRERVLSVGLAALVGGCSAFSGPDTGAIGDITYSEDVQPVLQGKCGPCHVTQGLGGTNFAATYGDILKAATSCPGQPVYRCIQTRVAAGGMPPDLGCTGNPAIDDANLSCLTEAELELIQVWIAEGLQE